MGNIILKINIRLDTSHCKSKRELFDYKTVMDNVPKVYINITGGKLSKISYDYWAESLPDRIEYKQIKLKGDLT